ncbi:hypothetical protein [Mesorhizobium sp. M0898]|uniref:dCTP deaminase domain-containing protein n=1 Tax=Mesorhizobium sp. M0898 TaxID=2957020 RepID=UPI00333CA84D
MSFANYQEIVGIQTSATPMIKKGRLENIKSCYYSLTIEHVFFPDKSHAPLKRSNCATDYITIDPMGIVWVRMKEILDLPDDICGILFQTNHYSKKGLSILNLTAVSPGYCGPITFIAVNLSGKKLNISWSDEVARIFFSKLSEKTNLPSSQKNDDLEKYDREISDNLSDRENSFLDIETLQKKLSTTLIKDAEDTLGRATKRAVFFGAMVVFGMTIIPPLTGYVYNMVNNAGYFVNNEESLRLVIERMKRDTDASDMGHRIDQLTAEVDLLRKQLGSRP